MSKLLIIISAILFAIIIEFLIRLHRIKTIEHFNNVMKTHIEVFITKNVVKIDSFFVQKDFENKTNASDIINEVNRRNIVLINHININYPENECGKILRKKYIQNNIREVDPRNNDGTTSFVMSKGKEFGICIRQKEDPKTFVPMNTIMYVNLHELAHLGSKSYGHNEEFTKNFLFLLMTAKSLGLYDPINYNTSPQKYCGTVVNENILYN